MSAGGSRRRRRRGRLLVGGVVALACLAVAGVVTGFAFAARPASGLVGYPSWLPKSTLHVHDEAVLTGTAARPALTVQGDGVEVRTPGWSVLATVAGPVVPGEGLPYQPGWATCTWTVTMSGATAPVPVAVGDFDTIDEDGLVYRPYLVPGRHPLPSRLLPGHTLSFQLRAVERVGEGLMRFAPIGHGDNRRVVAQWDFDVEND
jgi:hypothetical protein